MLQTGHRENEMLSEHHENEILTAHQNIKKVRPSTPGI